jgi:hypothetical protein
MERITSAQEIYLQMLDAGGRWGRFNGPRIAADLRTNLPLWRNIVFTRQTRMPVGSSDTELRHRVDLIALRDSPKGAISLDRLFIVPEPGKQDEFEALARDWLATEMSWIPRTDAASAVGRKAKLYPDYAADEPRYLLNLWWE